MARWDSSDEYWELAELLASLFAPSVRTRAEQAFRDGAVTLVAVGGRRARAEVKGDAAAPYRVEIALATEKRDQFLSLVCECPRTPGREACEHLYATLLELDEVGEDLEFDASRPGWYVTFASRAQGTVQTGGAGAIAVTPRREGDWRGRIGQLSRRLVRPGAAAGSFGAIERRREAWFLLKRDADDPARLAVQLLERVETVRGDWGKLKRLELDREGAATYANEAARPVLVDLLALAPEVELHASYLRGYRPIEIPLPPSAFASLLPRLCALGTLGWSAQAYADPDSVDEIAPLTWDERGYLFEAKVEPRPDGVAICGLVWRADGGAPAARIANHEVALPVPGLALNAGRLGPLRGTSTEWMDLLSEGDVVVPKGEIDDFVASIAGLPMPSPFVDFEVMGWSREERCPRPHIRFTTAKVGRISARTPVEIRLRFEYPSAQPEGESGSERRGGASGAPAEPSADSEPLAARVSELRAAMIDPKRRVLVPRDFAAERAIVEDILGMGARRRANTPQPVHPHADELVERDSAELQVAHRDFTEVAMKMLARGWRVEADGVPWRRSSTGSISVRSDIDWFELEAHVEFEGGERVELPTLLRALRERSTSVVLGDGSRGLLPETWLARMLAFTQLGSLTEGVLRFAPTQAAILDILLAAREADGEGVEVDAHFRDVREQLRVMRSIAPREAPKEFRGTLRPYQRDGLAWLHHTQSLGLGGCLADDMGLGKTIQVLALLASRAQRRGDAPSLVVAPSSVVDNWVTEAARFAPELSTVAYRGSDRAALRRDLASADLVVMSYAVLRLDITALSRVEFDYAVLDEAQTIKNPRSQVAKSVRLLRAAHRLALTGTPIENHLGDLFSIFEFLNPGLLGRAPSMQKLARTRGKEESAAVDALARGLRPLILRRTKAEVLRDLPEKTEQVLTVDLTAEERSHYDQLRRYYRQELLGKVEQDGVERSRIVILEALLRLRQAACHRALLDADWRHAPSAKLDLLVSQLESVVEDDHKVLVFSQFTRLLGLVRDRLDAQGIGYSYLDGSTRNRAEKIEAFQKDPDCPVFVISLKAGGVGLNLTAADYVYLLDPWWNPAVESQAIDRAHRIGQKRPVFGYRLIARDTVEERVLELQQRKRDLADTFLDQTGGSLAAMTLEDLDTLLS